MCIRFASGNADLPGNGGAGGSGLFRTIAFTRQGRQQVLRRQRRDDRVRDRVRHDAAGACTLGYGNASQPGSPHLEDQLPLMVQKTLHPVWREKKDIEANLASLTKMPRLPRQGVQGARSAAGQEPALAGRRTSRRR